MSVLHASDSNSRENWTTVKRLHLALIVTGMEVKGNRVMPLPQGLSIVAQDRSSRRPWRAVPGGDPLRLSRLGEEMQLTLEKPRSLLSVPVHMKFFSITPKLRQNSVLILT